MLHNKCGWCGTWDDFFNIDEKEFILKLKYFYSELPWVNEIGQAHCLAWKHEYHALQNTLRGVVADTIINPSSCYLVFEHELTGEAGKRLADANIILPTGDFIIVEFKHKLSVDEVEVDRLNTDLNYISKFHSESINLNNHAFLAITNPNANFQIKNTKFQLDIIKGGLLNGLKNFLIRLINNRPLDSYDASRWLEGRYYRQPSILYGTVKAFFDGELPNLKGEAQENIKEVRNCLLNIYKDARHHKKRYVVMVNGRPGAGKTLLGISMVADLIKEYGAEQLQPVLLSGNVPLVNVLRYTLDYYAETQHQTQKN